MLEVAKTRGCSILQSWNFGGECGEYGCKAQRSIGGIFNWSIRNACGNAPGSILARNGFAVRWRDDRCGGRLCGQNGGGAGLDIGTGYRRDIGLIRTVDRPVGAA
jgi:hypothetical protein